MIIKVGGVTLPSPVEMSIDDEIIWSSDTGRTLSGQMVGDVISEKKNISIQWGILDEDEFLTIKNSLIPGFFPFSIHDNGEDITLEGYRSAISKDYLGLLSGKHYYRSTTVSIIQR